MDEKRLKLVDEAIAKVAETDEEECLVTMGPNPLFRESLNRYSVEWYFNQGTGQWERRLLLRGT